MYMLFKTYLQKIIVIFTCILYTQGCVAELHRAYPPTHETIEDFEIEKQVDQLLLLIQKRLVIMHEVARTKWSHNLPIEDKMREQQVLADLTAKANHHGLDENFTSRFFQAQMDAAKEIQKNDFLTWKENGLSQFDKVFSLKDDLRLYIDQLNNEMILLLSKIYKKTSKLSSNYILEHPISIRNSDYIEDKVWLLAISPLY